MDAVQTDVQAPAETAVDVAASQDSGVPIEDSVDARELADSAVEAQTDTSEVAEILIEAQEDASEAGEALVEAQAAVLEETESPVEAQAAEPEGAEVSVAAETAEPEEAEPPAEVQADASKAEEVPVEAQAVEPEGAEVSVAAETAEPEEAEPPAEVQADASKAEEVPVEAPAEIPEEEEGELEVQADASVEDTSEMGELPVEDWDYQRPKRGEVRDGVILSIQDQEIIVDVGVKRDGIVPYADMQRMGPEALAELSVGDEVPVYILRPEDQDGNLLVSLFLARQTQAWTRAQEMFEKGEVWEEAVVGYNKGGLVIPVGDIRGFVPASQVPGFPLGLGQEEKLTRLSERVGEVLQVKIIEINRRKRRLILSATAAQQQWRKRQREKLLEELREGEVRKGVVSSLCSFGAFVDLGGADGLVHLSELSWRRIRHPREAVRVGEEIEVYVLRLDHERKRIGLSLKRLLPEPWALVEDKYELGQLVEGVVTNVVDFGAFAEIEEGVEGLIHVSELSEANISHPRDVVKKGDLLLLRIIRIDARRKRLGLSLKRVLESEWAEWAARLAMDEERKEAEAREAEIEAAAEEEEAVEAVAEVEAAAEEEEAVEAVAEVEAAAEEEEAAEVVAEVEAAAEEEAVEAVAEVEAAVEEEEAAEAVAEVEAVAEEEAVEVVAEVEAAAEDEGVEVVAEVETTALEKEEAAVAVAGVGVLAEGVETSEEANASSD